MVFGLGQFNPTIGDVAGNQKRILEMAHQAAQAGVRLLVFPELSLVGYPPQDLLDYSGFVDEIRAHLDALAAQMPVAALVGFVERNPSREGKPFFNSAALLRGGRVEAVYRKRLLPSYDVFDDERYFEPGQEVLVFDHEGVRFGVTICEDIWNHPDFSKRGYAAHPLREMREKDVEWVVNLSASPFHLGKPETRKRMLEGIVQRHGMGVLFCNQVGGNDDLIFDGASLAIAPDGKWCAQAPAFESRLVVFEKDKPTLSPWPASPAQWTGEALTLGLRDFIHKSGAQKVCLGLSGGVDSSVVASLAVRALGAENVKGVLLPSGFTSGASNEDALALAKSLGIQTVTLPIEGLFTAAKKTLADQRVMLPALGEENLQPRLRMLLLMAVSASDGSVVLNTANKSELAAGYATLYGDTLGAVGVLGDLTKAQVYELARWLNTQGAGIPERVLQRAPSAELRPDQKDEDSLPPYPVLDRMVSSAVENQAIESDWRQIGASAEQAALFSRLYRQSEYKRRQFPPILRVSTRAFGRGRRIPLAARRPF